MSSFPPEQRVASQHRAVAYGGAIEWEELPSLAGSLSQRLVARGSPARDAVNTAFRAPWAATLPVQLDTISPSEPFMEALKGLSMREVKEPDVFRHFFGPQAHSR